METLEPTWTLEEKIKTLPESERKDKILAFMEKKERQNIQGDQRITRLLYRSNLQMLVDSFYNNDCFVWNKLDEYLLSEKF